jgi:hypothetical protein
MHLQKKGVLAGCLRQLASTLHHTLLRFSPVPDHARIVQQDALHSRTALLLLRGVAQRLASSCEECFNIWFSHDNDNDTTIESCNWKDLVHTGKEEMIW